MKPKFSSGENIAIKVPVHEFDKTVAFYRDILGFEEVEASSPATIESVAFKFGDKNLWIDKVAGISQAEVWLEVVTNDITAASRYLAEKDCVRRDEIEALPGELKAFWISSPSNIIHLVNEKDR